MRTGTCRVPTTLAGSSSHTTLSVALGTGRPLGVHREKTACSGATGEVCEGVGAEPGRRVKHTYVEANTRILAWPDRASSSGIQCGADSVLKSWGEAHRCEEAQKGRGHRRGIEMCANDTHGQICNHNQ